MILIDDRTGSAELEPHISPPKALCHLPFADVCWSGHGPQGPVSVGVERKRIDDLLQSMTSGRLSGHQVIGLRENYDYIYLLVEGMWRPDQHTGILQKFRGSGRWSSISHGSRRFMARDVYNFLNTMSVICGLHVVTTANIQESGRWIDSSFAWWSKPWKRHTSHQQFHVSNLPASINRPNPTTRLALQLDGVGPDKAKALGFAFRTPLDLSLASEDQLRRVPGIGPKLATSIIQQLRG